VVFEKASEIKADDMVATRWVPWFLWPLAGPTVGLMAVSLIHLSDGAMQLTRSRHGKAGQWRSGLNCMLISVALAQLAAPADVKKDIATVARCMEAPW
jgi:hypothetical protein